MHLSMCHSSSLQSIIDNKRGKKIIEVRQLTDDALKLRWHFAMLWDNHTCSNSWRGKSLPTLEQRFSKQFLNMWHPFPVHQCHHDHNSTISTNPRGSISPQGSIMVPAEGREIQAPGQQQALHRAGRCCWNSGNCRGMWCGLNTTQK